MADDMAKVRVTRDVTIVPNQTSTVQYKAGWEGSAPRDHIEQIVNAGAGEAVSSASQAQQRPNPPQAAPAPSA